MSGKKKNTGSALAVFTSPVDVMQILQDELNGLKAITESAYKTSGNLDGFGDIKNEQKIENLIRAMSSVIGRESLYNQAADVLGISDNYPAFQINGGNAETWSHDIKLRIAVISHAERKAELEELLKEAKSFMTVDDQKELFMKKLQAKLNRH